MRTGTAPRWRTLAATGAALACGVTAACGGGSSSSAPARPAASTSSGRPGPQSSSPAPAASSPSTGASTSPAAPASACVTKTLGRLTLAQRVGQLFLVAVAGDQANADLAKEEDADHFGAVLLNKSAAGARALAAQTAGMQKLGAASDDGIGLFVAANQEGGEIQQLTGPGFATMPSELTQGAWPDSTLRAQAAQWGTDLRAAGVNLDLAPVMDVVPTATAAGNAPIGALDRQYGPDPEANGAHGSAFIEGLARAGVTSVAKHFPGLGRVTGNTDFTANVTDTVTTPDDPYLNSFRAAIVTGVPMVMVASATYTKIDRSHLAAFSPAVLRLLRGQLGFTGVIVSDDLGEAAAVQAVPAGQRALEFLSAGGDLVTSQSPGPAEQMAAAVRAKAASDSGFARVVDAAAGQVLSAKERAGLLRC